MTNSAASPWIRSVSAGWALMLSLASGSAAAAIPDSERQALIDFYDSTNGTEWFYSTNWNGPPGSECTWYGIQCDEAQTHVIAIEMGEGGFGLSHNLSGTLPTTLGALTMLERIDVSGNAIGGQLAPLSSLAHLTDINVAENAFTGAFPEMSGFRELSYFQASSNPLQGPIPDLSGLTSLVAFDVSNANLHGPLPSLAGLTQLQYFSVVGNQLDGSIPPLDDLPNLLVLDLSRNQLSGPIPSLAGAPSLTRLDLSSNQLSGPLPSFEELPNLRSFEAGENRLKGTIPPLGGLTVFRVADNQLTGSIPPLIDTANAKSFGYLNVKNNQLTGTLPALDGLDEMVEFTVSGNRLEGPPPTHVPPFLLGAELCPNVLTPSPSSDWDQATGIVPWYRDCAELPDAVFSDGFDPSGARWRE